MAALPIRLDGDPVVRQKAKKVSRIDRSIESLIDDMFDTMRAAPGVGLAAPQVGMPLRVIVVEADGESYALVNPDVVKSKGDLVEDEGCLSIPNWYGPVPRAQELVVKGRDRSGKAVRIRAQDFLARILQHEIDHLDGVLFVDRMADRNQLRYIAPEDQVARREKEL